MEILELWLQLSYKYKLYQSKKLKNAKDETWIASEETWQILPQTG